jgi:hypothetical protein
MRRRWQLLLIGLAALCMTGLGIFIALAGNIEEPPGKGELVAIASVAACNLLWSIPWVVVQRRRADRPMWWSGVLLFAVIWSPFVVRSFHHPRFDPATWKRSVDPGRSYAGYPAHAAGYMVTDIIESEVCIGKTRSEIEEMLGSHYFPQSDLWALPGDTCIGYFYSDKILFDGCDKLLLCFERDVCVHAGYFGCD